jgi:cytochrome P450
MHILDNNNTYGRLYQTPVADRTEYFTHTPELIESILVTRQNFFLKDYALRALLGNGLITSQGDLWLRERRIAQRAFRRERLDEYVRILWECANNYVSAWSEGPINVQAEMYRLSIEVVYKTLFGRGDGINFRHLDSTFQTACEEFERLLGRFVWPTPSRKQEPGSRKRFRQAMLDCDQVVANIIDTYSAGLHAPYFDSLMERLRRGDIDRSLLRDHFRTFLIAGQETTALASSYSLHLLAHYPHAQDRVREEVRRGSWPPMTIDDLKAFPYLNGVMKESLRLYPPIWAIQRKATGACVIDGLRVDTGSRFNLLQLHAHRNPSCYRSPNSFEPQRWTPEFEMALAPGSYFPFGLGARMCIGDRFAMSEISILLGEVVRKYLIRPIGSVDIAHIPQQTLLPASPIMIDIERLSEVL